MVKSSLFAGNRTFAGGRPTQLEKIPKPGAVAYANNRSTRVEACSRSYSGYIATTRPALAT